MHRIPFLLLVLALSSFASGQDLKSVQRSIASNDWASAKTQIDRYLSDSSHAGEAGAWYYKGKVYTEMSKQAKGPEKLELQKGALQSFKTYQVLDDQNRMMELDQNVDLFRIYDAAYNEGISLYNKKAFSDALGYFRQAMDTKDYIYTKSFSLKGLRLPKLDTQLVNLSGMAAWQSGDEASAIGYFEQLTGAGLKSKEFKHLYALVAGHYLGQKDPKGAGLLATGQKLFPEDRLLWEIVQLEELNLPERESAYATLVKKHPEHAVLLLHYAGTLLDNNSAIEKRDAAFARLMELNKAGVLKPYERMQMVALVHRLLQSGEGIDDKKAAWYREQIKNM
jgi:tetratricopeptide (TPR) repeat protein